jgi:hypothetical protein
MYQSTAGGEGRSMSHTNGQFTELWRLLEALCEDRLSRAEAARLEEIVLNDAQARRLYLEYMDLHGSLYWDAASGIGGGRSKALPVSDPTMDAVETEPAVRVSPKLATDAAKDAKSGVWIATLVAAVCLLLAVVQFVPGLLRPHAANTPVAEHQPRGGHSEADAPGRQSAPRPTTHPPLRLDSNRIRTPAHGEARVAEKTPRAIPESVDGTRHDAPGFESEAVDPGSSEAILAYVDRQIREGWKQADVAPSPRADDSEWLRRVYLDIAGHIPPVDVAERFLKDENPRKRAVLVDTLLSDTDYVRNMTTIWTNLLIGRSDARGISRPALKKFLRESFARNRPWNEIVHDLVAAEGRADENGAANFLLAHLNNEAVPATAITARLFMGVQIHCTQCHNHPFNDSKQEEFWAYNSFFQQTREVARREMNPKTGARAGFATLVSLPVGGPTFYEGRDSRMSAALPSFEGQRISPEPDVNRRQELAKLMTQGERPQVAVAMVNRVWAHFLGHGFTRPVDDIGPHNAPTHPELLDRLSREFVRSGYDLKQLIRWICNSEVYHLSSRFHEGNLADNPEQGELPLFSRVYVKSMTAEQLYDSLIVATAAHRLGNSTWADAERQRQQWLQQFVMAFDTDENDETLTFDGTIPQALMRMNSDLIENALRAETGTFFNQVLQEDSSETEKIRKLWLSALSRYPTDAELAAMRKLLRKGPAASSPDRPKSRQVALADGLQDMFWAFLNSSEFILVY